MNCSLASSWGVICNLTEVNKTSCRTSKSGLNMEFPCLNWLQPCLKSKLVTQLEFLLLVLGKYYFTSGAIYIWQEMLILQGRMIFVLPECFISHALLPLLVVMLLIIHPSAMEIAFDLVTMSSSGFYFLANQVPVLQRS